MSLEDKILRNERIKFNHMLPLNVRDDPSSQYQIHIHSMDKCGNMIFAGSLKVYGDATHYADLNGYQSAMSELLIPRNRDNYFVNMEKPDWMIKIEQQVEETVKRNEYEREEQRRLEQLQQLNQFQDLNKIDMFQK